MERFSVAHARAVADTFFASDKARAWDMFGRTIKNAIVDAIVMGEIYNADAVRDVVPFTAAEVMKFRATVVKIIGIAGMEI
jgi:hypothetical protein